MAFNRATGSTGLRAGGGPSGRQCSGAQRHIPRWRALRAPGRDAGATHASHAVSWLRLICALILLVLLGSCGDDGGTQEPPVVGPLPTGPDDARAYSEDFLAHNPQAL